MEPDIDSILSKKIRQAESRPVSWNKQAVWQNLQSQTVTRRRHVHFYYAAAAVVLLLIYFVPKESNLKVTDASPPRSSTTPSESGTPAMSETKRPPATDPSPVSPSNSDLEGIPAIPNNMTDTIQAVQPDTAYIEEIPEPTIDIQIPTGSLSLTEELTVPAQKIRPVVGIITGSYSQEVLSDKRKKRLRKLESIDPTPWENPGNALVFAVRR